MTTWVASSSKDKCKRRVCEAAMCSYKESHMWCVNGLLKVIVVCG